ncbi:relaxase/mobilization nuclease domain-containing protein [Rhodoferax bucti]|uniref:relaxase/mobilization nuclease domain-containing protein n=1 Tax=Rhodoferax bucti TaxID=2576305 RepID=UPI0011082F04|nr:relaxase/mobilization nuclease domain-containing protein [Rhodoferax bucti]
MSSPTAAADAGQRAHERTSKRLRSKAASQSKSAAAKLSRTLKRTHRRSRGASPKAGSWNQAGKTVSLLFKKHRGSVIGDAYSLADKSAQHIASNMLGTTAAQRRAEFKLDCRRHPLVSPDNLIVHISLSRPEGHSLSLSEWHEVGKTWLKNIGAEGCNYTIARHPGRNDHVHIVYSRSKPDGSLVSDSNDFWRGRAAAREAARSLGIEVADFAPKPTQAPPTDRAVSAHRRADRRGTKRAWVDPNIIHQALSKSKNFEDFQQNLKTAGIDCKLATSSTGQTTGVLFRSADSSEFLAGSTLDRSLSLPKIQQQLNAANGISPPSRRAPMPGPGMRHAPLQNQPPRLRGG